MNLICVSVVEYFLLIPGTTVLDRRSYTRAEAINRFETNLGNTAADTCFIAMAAERDNITYDDLRLYDFFHTLFTTKLPLEEFYRQFRMLYDRTFAKQGLLDLRDPRAPTLTEKGLNPEFAEMYRRISNLAAHHR